MDTSSKIVIKARVTGPAVKELIEQHLGSVAVLCIVGYSGTGKTTALLDFMQVSSPSTGVAYVNCKELAFDRPIAITVNGHTEDAASPFDITQLGNARIVVVDEPQVAPDLVMACFEYVSPHVFDHYPRLLVLAVQDPARIERLNIPSKAIRYAFVEIESVLKPVRRAKQNEADVA